MKKLFWTVVIVFSMSCGDIVNTQYAHRNGDSVTSPDSTHDYVIMPEVVISVDPYQEIIFTEEEVRDSFEDPTEFGSAHFSAIYIPTSAND